MADDYDYTAQDIEDAQIVDASVLRLTKPHEIMEISERDLDELAHLNATLLARIIRVKALHYRRPHTANGGIKGDGFFDFVAHGQTEFPDLCDHCNRSWPCETILALQEKN